MNMNMNNNISDQTQQVITEAKKLGSQIYDEGKERFDDMQREVKKQSDHLSHKVHQNPLSSLLIAAGVGFLLAKIMR